MKQIILPLLIGTLLTTPALARDQISIVGSSTVYPFATMVAERFGQGSGFKTPVIESTGTGGGMKMFCGGIGTEFADITNASRAIKSSEKELCAKNGVTPVEFIVGNDGLAFASSNAAKRMNLGIEHIAVALSLEFASEVKTWADVDTFVAKKTNTAKIGLPNRSISVMIPPPTSGTRDAMGSLFMKNGYKKLGIKGKGYKSIREDGAVVEMGENDNLIVEKLVSDAEMFGVFGYSFFDTNRDKVQAADLNGVKLTFDNISSYTYPGARPLFFYVKKEHVGVIPGIKEFLSEFISEKAMSIDGYLFPAGLVPLSDDDYAKQVTARNSL